MIRRRLPLAGVLLLTAGVACATSAQPKVVAPVPGFTMPPAWTPTPAPTVFAVPGWETLSGNQVEVMLPPSYEGGDPVLLGEALADLIDQVPEYADVAEAIRQDPTGYRLLAIDRDTGSILAVTARDVPESVSMTEYVDKIGAAVVEQFPGSEVLQDGVVSFRDGEAGWMLFQFTIGEAVSWQLSYAIRRDGQVWNFNYGALREDYPQLQPIFDQSLQTLEFTP